MIKLETHCHCLGGSNCAHAPIQTLLKEYFDNGYKGIVLTNHLHPTFFARYPFETDKEKIAYYFSLRDVAIKEAKKYGIKVFTGVEVYAQDLNGIGVEFMLYGFEDGFLYDNPRLFNLSQKELFKIAEKNHLFMYQTHPYRASVMTGNPNYLHGAEAFNGHVNHKNNNALATQFCERNNLISMSGTDYHDAGQPITGGIIIPENIDSNEKLVEFLFNEKYELIQNKDAYIQGYYDIRQRTKCNFLTY